MKDKPKKPRKRGPKVARGPAPGRVETPGQLDHRAKKYEKTISHIEETGSFEGESLTDIHPELVDSRNRTEFLMAAIYRLRVRKYTINKIAEALKITEHAVEYYVSKINKTFEREAQAWSFVGQIGRSIAMFRDIQAAAAKIYDDQKARNSDRLRALHEMASTEKAVLHTLGRAGFFETVKLRPQHGEGGTEFKKGDFLQSMLNGLLVDPPDEDTVKEDTPDNFEISEDSIRLIN